MRVFQEVAEAVGDTPLVRLSRIVEAPQVEALAKLEYLNPMGSVKDRVARYLVDREMASGRLGPGGVVVESSSGNTAMGLAMMSVLRGLRCRIVVRRQTSPEKLDSLRAMGAELVLVDGELPPEHPDSYNRMAQRLADEDPAAFFPDQHNNRDNNLCHYETTGPELWEQMEGRIDVFVAGIGTGGTVSGVGRYLKEQNPGIRVVAVDVVGSVFTEYFRSGKVGRPGPYRVEGLGDEEIIDCPEFDLFDEMLQVTDRQAFETARALARREAMLVGGSSGAAVWGVQHVARHSAPGTRIATVLPDSGNRYLSTIFNDEWLEGVP